MCLSGTVLTRNYKAALIEPAGKRDLEILRPGAELLKWRLLEVAPRSVLLGQDDRKIRLSLDDRHDTGQDDADSPTSALSPSQSIAARAMRLRAQRAQQRQGMVVPVMR